MAIPLLEYFARFDLFSGGLIGFFSLFAFLFIFTYFGVRSSVEKPAEKTVELLLPPVLIGFILNFAGINSLLVGIIVILAYIVFSKGILKLEKKEWIISSITIFALLAIFGSLDLFSRNILFLIYLAYAIIKSQKEIRDKKKPVSK